MDRKILFLDLDGTLLNSSREVSPGNRAALEQALGLGHKVVINTGRPLHSAIIQNDRLGFHQEGCYVVSFNGGMIYDAYREKLVYSHCLPLDRAKAILALCNHRNIHVQTYDREDVLVEPRWDDGLLQKYCGRILMHYRVLPSFETGLTQEPPKVLAVSEEDHPALEQLRQELLQRFDNVRAHAVDVGDRRILADVEPAVNAAAQMLGEVAVNVAVDLRARMRRVDGDDCGHTISLLLNRIL